ncbi:MAG: low temperature requirement protein A [Rheinheimera sp.]|nr:low temperature requirement protein A [Rheinheimera sp.]
MQKQWLSQYWRQGIRAMPARDVHEHHRAATPLELLFDLVAVIAIAAAAGELHHAVAHGHMLEGAGKFVLAFFAIWWVRAPLRLMSEQQSCLQLPQARRRSEGIVALFRAAATPLEAIAGAPDRAIAE